MSRKISIEVFFPSKQEDRDTFWRGIESLAPLQPSFISLTCKSKLPTDDIPSVVEGIKRRTDLKVVQHITAWNRSEQEVICLLRGLAHAGADGILALHGDTPPNPIAREVEGRLTSACDILRLAHQHEPQLKRYAAILPDGNPFDATPPATSLYQKSQAGAQAFIAQASYAPMNLAIAAAYVRNSPAPHMYPGLFIPETIPRFKRFGEFCHVPSVITAIRRIEQAPDEAQGIEQLVRDFLSQIASRGLNDMHLFSMNRFAHTVAWWSRIRG